MMRNATALFSRCRSVLRAVPLEAYLWAAGLAALACTDPASGGLLRLCPLDRLGFTFCPGCGLGHAVAHLFRGELALSFEAHPLGVFAVAVLGGRILSLVRDAQRRPAPSIASQPSPEVQHSIQSNG